MTFFSEFFISSNRNLSTRSYLGIAPSAKSSYNALQAVIGRTSVVVLGFNLFSEVVFKMKTHEILFLNIKIDFLFLQEYLAGLCELPRHGIFPHQGGK